MADKLFLTKKETAKLLSVSLPTINRRIADGSIPIVRIGSAVRVPVSFVERLAALSQASNSMGA